MWYSRPEVSNNYSPHDNIVDVVLRLWGICKLISRDLRTCEMAVALAKLPYLMPSEEQLLVVQAYS